MNWSFTDLKPIKKYESPAFLQTWVKVLFLNIYFIEDPAILSLFVVQFEQPFTY
jgi:hypothetical protein